MKFLHTSDLHLGKRLINKSRIDEQREVLEEIANLCESEKVDVLIVAGDVFDNFVPTSEAEQLFFDFLKQTASPSRAVVVISGNHDDWQRLSASHYLAGKLNAYIFGGENVPPASGDIVKCVEAGNNYLKIKKDKAPKEKNNKNQGYSQDESIEASGEVISFCGLLSSFSLRADSFL